jgi:hypothetical protein
MYTLNSMTLTSRGRRKILPEVYRARAWIQRARELEGRELPRGATERGRGEVRRAIESDRREELRPGRCLSPRYCAPELRRIGQHPDVHFAVCDIHGGVQDFGLLRDQGAENAVLHVEVLVEK